MKFSDSNLPNDALVEKAFDLAYKNTMVLAKAALDDFNKQIQASYAENMRALNNHRDKVGMSDDEYEANKKHAEKIRDAQLKQGPSLVERELNNVFKRRCVGVAETAYMHSDEVSPEALAAMLLVSTCRSPKDFRALEAEMGAVVADYVAEIQHIDNYEGERDALMSVAADDVKRAFISMLAINLEQVKLQHGAKMKSNPKYKARFAEGQEADFFEKLQPAWGCDAKLQKHALALFNEVAVMMGSSYRLETGAQGELELVKGPVNPPALPPSGPNLPAPKKPSGPGGIGDDVF